MSLTSKQYQTIMRTYDSHRANALYVQRKHLSEIRTLYPEYSALEDKTAEIAAEYGKLYLENPDISLSEMDARLHEITLQKENFLKNHGYAPSYVEPEYVCPDCQDTGYIDNRKCHCFRQVEIEILYNQSNIRELLKTENFSNLRYDFYEGEDLDHFQKAVTCCHNFVDSFDNSYNNILLYGNVGTGKSFLSGCIAYELLKTGHSVIYFSAMDLFSTLSDKIFHHSGEGYDEIVNTDIYECDLLIIDDLGTELGRQFASSSLFSCLNERYLRRKSTIISTNFAFKDIQDQYSDRVLSRLIGNFTMLKLTGSDIRVQKHKKLNTQQTL